MWLVLPYLYLGGVGLKKFLFLALGAVVLAGCDGIGLHVGPQVVGSGKVSSVSRHVGSFKSVKVDGSMDAVITIGKQSDLKIEGDDNVVPLVKTEIQGNTLRIYTEKGFSSQHGLKVTFTVPVLEGASLNGSGDIDVHNYQGSALDLAINGSGDIKASGHAGKLSASIRGSGDMNLYDLIAGDASVSIAGSGNANVNVTGNLDGSIAGSGDIHYKGHPKQVGKSIAGSGGIAPGD